MAQPAGGLPATSIDARHGALAQAFASAAPFGHVVIDDFLDPGLARALLAQFPAFERGESRGEDGRAGPKSTFERIRSLGEAYARFDDLARSESFLALVGGICGIDGLLHDPWYLGGGTHENRPGASLDPHVDFSFHPLERWQRRVNLILYLNPEWDPAWGGNLALYRDPRSGDPAAVSVAPAFNRCVIFETHDHSWHGFEPIRPPDGNAGLTRKSIALYFYTRAATDAGAGPVHSTVYVGRPLPDRLRAGHALDQADVDDLRSLLADRDNRIAMQYAEIAKLMALVQAHERGTVGSLLYLARRAGARLRRR